MHPGRECAGHEKGTFRKANTKRKMVREKVRGGREKKEGEEERAKMKEEERKRGDRNMGKEKRRVSESDSRDRWGD